MPLVSTPLLATHQVLPGALAIFTFGQPGRTEVLPFPRDVAPVDTKAVHWLAARRDTILTAPVRDVGERLGQPARPRTSL